jgi:CheY-like chemotaxis protein
MLAGMNTSSTPAAGTHRTFGDLDSGLAAAGHLARTAAPLPLRLLLVDDCRVNRMLVTTVLTRWGIVPAIACNGEQAVRITQRQAFDIVLMDVLMPVMDGIVATARIRQTEREDPQRTPMPIIAYTSLDLGSNPEHLARVGLNAVLAKPCNATSLAHCLAQWCGHKFAGN